MTKDEIFKLIETNGLSLHGDIEHFATLVEDRVLMKQLELPEPRLTGKLSVKSDVLKCTGCTGTWTDREDAKHHSCKDYQ